MFQRQISVQVIIDVANDGFNLLVVTFTFWWLEHICRPAKGVHQEKNLCQHYFSIDVNTIDRTFQVEFAFLNQCQKFMQFNYYDNLIKPKIFME